MAEATAEEEVKPREKDITLPTGLSGRIRRLTLGELDKFADAKAAKKGVSIDNVLNRIWLETYDLGRIYQGPFADFSDGQIDWQRVLDAERNWILRELRKMTHGSDLYFRQGCTSLLCEEIFTVHVDLDSLEWTPPSEEALLQLEKDGENLFHRELPYTKKKVAFKMLQGCDTATAAKIVRQHKTQLATSTFLLRVPYISDTQGPGAARKFAETLDGDDAEWLREQWEAADLWVDESKEVQCPECKHVFDVQIPYDARFFSRRSARPPKGSRISYLS